MKLRERILLMYDPTPQRGRRWRLAVPGARDFADAGGAVLFYSTEIAELVNLCDRVLVMYSGRVVRELSNSAISEEGIMRAALGETHEEAATNGAAGRPVAAAGGMH